ncbi:MAG: hypothetical protein AB7O96_06410 [Pseudobdellovibrionaceae bacterium]
MLSVRQMVGASLLGVVMGLALLAVMIFYMEKVNAAIPRGSNNLVDQLKVLSKESRARVADMYVVNSIANSISPKSLDQCHSAIIDALTLNPCQPLVAENQGTASMIMQGLIIHEATSSAQNETRVLPATRVAI